MQYFGKYLEKRLPVYGVLLLFGVIFGVSFLLYRLPMEAVLYPYLVCLLAAVVLTSLDFVRTKAKHEALMRLESMTDIIEQSLPQGDSSIEADYQEILRRLREEHMAFASEKDKEFTDMVEYYTVWAHQIKTPIASMRLHLQSEDSPLARQLTADLLRIEQYVEMVLTFLRLRAESTDYVIRACELDGIIRASIRKFSHEFIGRKLSLHYEPCGSIVITDEKWLSFVIEQVLSNALKYTRKGGITITVTADHKLSICDTGIGIAPEDLPRIFAYGYTGTSGRTDKKASGIGLYLCRRICTNLGHTITVASQVDKGTVVTLDLGQERRQFE